MSDIIESAIDYSSYRELINVLVASGRTTGNSQSEKLVEFTQLNIQRMNRLDKTISINTELKEVLAQLNKSLIWLVIGEAWCGDCAQIIPIINKITTASNGKIKLKIISKDLYPELIETYHTNGAKAIPKMLIIDAESSNVLSTWGPRPKPAQDIMLNWKANKDKISWEDLEKDLHLWYARDKGQTIMNELAAIINTTSLIKYA